MSLSSDDRNTNESVPKFVQQVHNVRSLLLKKKNLEEKRSSFSIVIALSGVLFVVVLTFIVFSFFQGFSFSFGSNILSGIAQVFGKDVQRDANGHTNILLVGVGGVEHDGANLTDTMMIASIDHTNNSVALLSIPRDLYVNVPKLGNSKINAVYDFALKQETGIANVGSNATTLPSYSQVQSAMTNLEDMVETISGVDIQYFLKVDFQGFIEVVDILGGIDVDVPRDLIDKEYPNESYGYETFAVRKGMRHFDGKTALKYARSRHSTSDFDRSQRQHMIMKAVLKKLEQKDYLTNPSQLKRMYYAVSENVVTNLELREIVSLGAFAKNLQGESILSAGYHDDATRIGGFLYTPQRAQFGGASVLLPNGANAGNLSYYKKMQLFAHMYLNSQVFYAEPPKILVVNATRMGTKRVSGVGQILSSVFTIFGVNIMDSVNAPDNVTLENSILVSMNDKAQKNALPLIEVLFPAQKAQYEKVDDSEELTQFLEEQTSMYDVVILVGKDYKELLANY